MKYNRLTLCLGVCAALLMGGCQNRLTEDLEPATPNTPTIENPYVEGELMVKFHPEVEDALDKIAQSGSTRSGIVDVDTVMDIIGGYEIERVFPYDALNEERTRQSGLHLWYVVRFEKESAEEVAEKFLQLGQVQKVDFNRTIKRAYKGKAIPLNLEAVGTRSLANAIAEDMNDPMLAKQWNLINNGDMFTLEGAEKSIKDADVQVAEAWEKCQGNEDIIVAVLDEGIYVDHPDLKANMWVNEREISGSKEDNDGNGYAGDYHGYNFVKEQGAITWNDFYDSGHGSHVAGIISAVNNNGVGISSIAGGNAAKGQKGVKIMSCQIFSGNYSSSILATARAIKYAADNGAVIAQCSWGYVSGAASQYEWGEQGFSSQEQWENGAPLEKDAFDYFTHNAGSPNGPVTGGIAIFAAGNETAPMAGFPGACDWAVSVAATAADYTPATYTNYGPGTTISAPGGDQDYYWEYKNPGQNYGEEGCILSTLPYNVSKSGYGYMEGTSMACPHVSGVMALAISYAADLRKQFSPDELKDMLYRTAVPIDDYMVGTKYFMRYVADIGPSKASSIKMSNYKGQMGYGQANAAALLAEIEGAGRPMHFPNIYVAVGGNSIVKPSRYWVGGDEMTFSVTIKDDTVATCTNEGGVLSFEGKKVGSTTATITASAGSTTEQHTFTITVREVITNNGWL